MKIIKRILNWIDGKLDLIAEAFTETYQADYGDNNPSGPVYPSGPVFMVIDASVVAQLTHQEQCEAQRVLTSLLWRTRRKLGPGEWLQVIRRNKNDGRFMLGPQDERKLF